MQRETKQLLNGIAQAIYDKKGFNILVLDIRSFSALADYVVIAEGNIDRHVKALSLAVKDKIHDLGLKPLFVEGERTGEWVVIDCSDVVVHLMVPDFRENYSLEKLWRLAHIVDVKIKTDKKEKDH